MHLIKIIKNIVSQGIKKQKSNMNAIKEKYIKEIIPTCCKKFAYTSPMQAPKLLKIVVNMGIGAAARNKEYLTTAIEELALITGQRPIITKAKKSEANFKIRTGMKLGCKATLRDEKMYNFLAKIVNFILPQTRDFKGLDVSSFDSSFNYSFGIKEMIFLENLYENMKRIQGMDVTFVTSANTLEESKFLLEQLGLIFKKVNKKG